MIVFYKHLPGDGRYYSRAENIMDFILRKNNNEILSVLHVTER